MFIFLTDSRKNESLEAKRRSEEEKKRYEATLKESQKDDDEFRRRSDSERRHRIAVSIFFSFQVLYFLKKKLGE